MILVDPRFGSERPGQRSSHRIVAETLPELGVEVEPVSMEFGDFMFLANGPEGPIKVGIELKTVSDFVTSMLSGRLKGHQIPGLRDTYQRVYLIVEGFYRNKRGGGLLEVPRGGGWRPLNAGPRPIFWADVEKFITSIEEAGVRVRRTRTSNETARVIASVLYSFWQKPYKDHELDVVYLPPTPMQLVREDEATARIRRACVALKTGIGYSRSKAVAERFRSIYNLVTAAPDEWEDIEGIGKGIAATTARAIREEIPGRAQKVSAGQLPKGRGVADRNRRHSRAGQDRQLDAGQRAQRRVSAARRGDRGAQRGQSKRP